MEQKGLEIFAYVIMPSHIHMVLRSLNGIIDQKIEYIHNNPLEAGYVTNPESWYYSSACMVSPLKVPGT